MQLQAIIRGGQWQGQTQIEDRMAEAGSSHDVTPWAQECRQPQEGGKGKERDSLLETPEEIQLFQHFDFSPVRPVSDSDLPDYMMINVYHFTY